ncbi:MAG: hypothetical protein WDN66_02640 [Candidatus Saccharibacteria bacterium]
MPKIGNAQSRGSVVELTISNRTIIRISAVIVGVLIVLWGVMTA